MDNPFRYDPVEYRDQVAHIAEHVVANDDALPTVAPRTASRGEIELNSYHGPAIAAAERDRLERLHPRLQR